MKGKTISLTWNGESVFRDMDVRYGETDREAFERLNQENAGKPEALRVKLRHENGKYLGYFGEGGTRSSLEGPDRPGPSSSRAIMARWPIATSSSAPWKVNTRHTPVAPWSPDRPELRWRG